MSTNDSVFNALKEAKEPLKAGEIAEITGLDKKDVDKAIKSLKDEGKIDSPKRCYYSVND